MIGKLDEMLRFNEAALGLRAQRQQLLASNIANADTPGYKARDIDFNQALSAALTKDQQQAGTPMMKTASQHLQASQPDIFAGTALQYRGVVQGSVDGNTVDMDVERNAFADNSIRYEASLTFLNGQLKGLLAAIQG